MDAAATIWLLRCAAHELSDTREEIRVLSQHNWARATFKSYWAYKI